MQGAMLALTYRLWQWVWNTAKLLPLSVFRSLKRGHIITCLWLTHLSLCLSLQPRIQEQRGGFVHNHKYWLRIESSGLPAPLHHELYQGQIQLNSCFAPCPQLPRSSPFLSGMFPDFGEQKTQECSKCGRLQHAERTIQAPLTTTDLQTAETPGVKKHCALVCRALGGRPSFVQTEISDFFGHTRGKSSILCHGVRASSTMCSHRESNLWLVDTERPADVITTLGQIKTVP